MELFRPLPNYDADFEGPLELREWNRDKFNFTRQEKQYLKTHSFLSSGQIKNLEITIRVAEDRHGRNWKNPNLHKAAHNAMTSGVKSWGPANLKLADKLFGRGMSIANQPNIPTRDQIIQGQQRQAPYIKSEGLLKHDPPPQIGKGPTGQQGILEADVEEMRQSSEERKRIRAKQIADIRTRLGLGSPSAYARGGTGWGLFGRISR